MKLMNASCLHIPLLLTAALSWPIQALENGTFSDGPSVPSSGAESSAPESGSHAFDPLHPEMLSIAPLIIPNAPIPGPEYGLEGNDQGVNWRGLMSASTRFLGVMHAFRLVTEPGTRSGLKGSFFGNYARSLENLHGWGDGDEFYVNYVGHPMQGSVASFLWIQNDRAYRTAEFGNGPRYWKSRLRAAAFAWGYSTQFEIGPLSEASMGAIQAKYPQQGFVDHVVTPSFGWGWTIAEDAIDKFVIKRLEGYSEDRWFRLIARTSLNPARSFANLLQGQAPWHRETRPGVLLYARLEDFKVRPWIAVPRFAGRHQEVETPDSEGPAPFEFNVTFEPEWFLSGTSGLPCLGGGATAAFRLSPSWQIVTDVGGCKMVGLDTDLSGDSLTYMVGPRWVKRSRGPWSAYLQVLVGGNKLTEERLLPETKERLEEAAKRDNKPAPDHAEYTEETETNGFTVATGGGVTYKLNRALAIRVADLSYRRSWTAPLGGQEYSKAIKLSSGVVLRFGTW
jgi:hypothetical protein